MSYLAFGLSIEDLTGPMAWLGVLTIAGLLVDAMGRQRGEPEPPVQPDLHNQVETMMRLKPGARPAQETPVVPKRL